MRLILVRHGETDWNRTHRFQGHTDTELNDTGRRQAELLGKRLRSLDADAIYSSDLKRAHTTATIALNGTADVVADERLREANFGVFEGLTYDEIKEQYPETFEGWRSAGSTVPEGGESFEQVSERLREFITELRENHTTDDTILLFGHGGTLTVLLCMLFDYEVAKRWQFRLNNASVSEIHLYDEGPILSLWNDTHHLNPPPPESAGHASG